MLSLPIPLRVLLAAQPELVTPVKQVVQRGVARHLLDSTELKADEGHGGAVTLIQRFGPVGQISVGGNTPLAKTNPGSSRSPLPASGRLQPITG